MKKGKINLNLGAVMGTEVAEVEVTVDEFVHMDTSFALEALNAEIALLDEHISFDNHIEGVVGAVEEFGIQDSVTLMYGETIEAWTGKWDAADTEGSVEELKKSLKKLGARTKEIVEAIIEKLKEFFAKFLVSEAAVRKSFDGQVRRVAALDAPEWTKEGKIVKVRGDFSEKPGMGFADDVFGQLAGGSFTLKKADKFLDGTYLNDVREAQAKAVEVKCEGNAKKAGAKAKAAGEATVKKLNALGVLAKKANAINAKKVEDAEKTEVSAVQATRGVAKVVSVLTYACLRELQDQIKVLRCIK